MAGCDTRASLEILETTGTMMALDLTTSTGKANGTNVYVSALAMIDIKGLYACIDDIVVELGATVLTSTLLPVTALIAGRKWAENKNKIKSQDVHFY